LSRSKKFCANKRNWTLKSVDLPKPRNTSKKINEILN
jgi:hypothetical protein